MDEIKSAEIDDIDRESLVKEIEQIRQAVGSISNTVDTEKSDAGSEYNFDDGKESEESEDELAIIRSPRYGNDAVEEKKLEKQPIPVHIITSESDNEQTEHDENTQDTITFSSTQAHPEFSQNLSGDISYEISEIVPRDNTGEVELVFTPVIQNSESRDTQGLLVPGSSTYQASSTQFDPVFTVNHDSGYTLTELQPPRQTSSFINKETDEDIEECWSPVYEMNFKALMSASETEQENRFRDGAYEEEDRTRFLDDDNEDGVEDQSEVHRCLRLNRRYQAVIEDELRAIERSLLENKEMQLGLTHMSQSSLTKAEAMAFKQRASYSYPYFKDKTKQGPPDNRDTKLRKDIGQPHPFKKASKRWTKEENRTLTDSVKSGVLESMLTPLLQRIEMLSPRRSKTEAEQIEIMNLKAEVERTKTLPISTLVQNHALTIDWEDITDKVLPSRTPSQCEMYWYNEIHPLLNKEAWIKDEDKLLLKLAKENNEEDWNTIARELKTNRSAVQCLRRYQRSLHKGFLKSKWEEEEDEQLLQAVKLCGVGAWEKVSSLLEGRTGSQCMHRYMKSINPDIKKGRWNKEEDDLLRKGLEKFGSNWSRIRKMIPQRTDSQIRERWSDVLSPSLNKGKWTTDEDVLLLKLVEEKGKGNWTKVASHFNGRNDNNCWRRWRFLKRSDPDFQLECASHVHRRATMVVNFSKRPNDRPSFGPEDVDCYGMPILGYVDGNYVPPSGVTIPSTSSTTKSSTKRSLASSSGKAPKARKPRANKRAQKAGGSLNVKRSRRSKPTQNSSHPSCPPDQSKSNRLASTSLDTQTNSQKKVVNTKTSNSSRPRKTKKKVTMPSPVIVSQASALPNALPMTYLTQFSVLLQAFSVDVSGVLKNVHPQSPQVTSQSQPTTTATTTATDGAAVVIQPCSQVTEACADGNGSSTECPAGKASLTTDHSSTCGEGTNQDSCDIVDTRGIRNDCTNDGPSRHVSVSQKVQNRSGLKRNDHDISYTRISSAKAKACNSKGFPQEVECTDGSGETNHSPNDTHISQIPGNVRRQGESHHDTSGTVERKQNNEKSEGMCRKEICVDNLGRFSDKEERPCLNAEHVRSSRGDHVSDEQRTKNNGTSSSAGTVLADSRCGSTHDIVILSSSSDEQDRIGKQNGRFTGTLSIRKKTENATENAKKRRRTVSSGDKNKRSKRDFGSCSEVKFVSDLDIEVVVEEPMGTPRSSGTDKDRSNVEGQVNGCSLTNSTPMSVPGVEKSLSERNQNDKSPRRKYPVRSTRGRPVSDALSVESTTADERNTARKGGKERDKTAEKTPIKVVHTDNRERNAGKGVYGANSTRNPRVPIVPPLPPSATTLKAFKKLLMLRKDLKVQADCLKPVSEKQTGAQTKDTQKKRSSETQQVNIGGNVTHVENALANCLLIDSQSEEASKEQYRGSLPYQQLVNRFNGLFLWPGFLSIVNPNFSRKLDGNDQVRGNKTRTGQGTSRKNP